MLKRTITAIIFVPIVILIVLKCSFTIIFLVVTVVSVLGMIEWLKLDDKQINIVKTFYILFSIFFSISIMRFPSFIQPVVLGIIVIHLLLNFENVQKESILKKAFYLSAVFYIALYTYFYKLAITDKGREVLILILFSIWIGDTAALFFGKKWGKHPLSPRISPHKTIEGAISGVIMGTAVAFLSGMFSIELKHGFLFCFTANIVGILGDLAESVPKRVFGKKDSGNLLPGHGGILDRLDSLSFAIPAIYYLKMLIE
ncbi:MAG: phosphatidate cytidylyltransferase [Desulfurellaceae bacterium]|nr:phosphatidate cytidylyltransferase [Desulfurellaceae bacterium]